MKIEPLIASAVVASVSGIGCIIIISIGSLGINDEVTIIDGNSIPESGLLR